MSVLHATRLTGYCNKTTSQLETRDQCHWRWTSTWLNDRTAHWLHWTVCLHTQSNVLNSWDCIPSNHSTIMGTIKSTISFLCRLQLIHTVPHGGLWVCDPSWLSLPRLKSRTYYFIKQIQARQLIWYNYMVVQSIKACLTGDAIDQFSSVASPAAAEVFNLVVPHTHTHIYIYMHAQSWSQW